MSFFSSLRQEQPQWSNVSIELVYLVDPQMGDAVDRKVKRKRKMIPALGVAWKDGSGRLLIHSTVLKCVIASGVRDPDHLIYIVGRLQWRLRADPLLCTHQLPLGREG